MMRWCVNCSFGGCHKILLLFALCCTRCLSGSLDQRHGIKQVSVCPIFWVISFSRKISTNSQVSAPSNDIIVISKELHDFFYHTWSELSNMDVFAWCIISCSLAAIVLYFDAKFRALSRSIVLRWTGKTRSFHDHLFGIFLNQSITSVVFRQEFKCIFYSVRV